MDEEVISGRWSFQTATKLDETSVVALSGIIACQIMDGQFDVAKEQLDFLKGWKSPRPTSFPWLVVIRQKLSAGEVTDSLLTQHPWVRF